MKKIKKDKISTTILMILIFILAFCVKSKVFAESKFTVNVEEEISIEVSNIKYTDAEWKIEDSNVAKIISTGRGGIQIGSYCNFSYSAKIEGKNKGSTTVRLQTTDGKVLASCILEVTNSISSIKLKKENIDMMKGEEYQLEIQLVPERPDEIDTMTWTSLDKNIAEVDEKGLVKAVNYGTTKVIVKIGEKETYCTINVKLPFADIKEEDWYYSAVKYNYENKMILGINNTTFAPESTLTRAMLVTILHRMEGMPYAVGTSKFSDVQNTNDYYYVAVKWATKNNIVSGYNNGKFGPNDPITREQLAVILNQYCKYKEKYKAQVNNLNQFKDASQISNFAKWGMQWATGAGVITGSNGNLNPQGTTTRAEAASMLYKYCLNIK